MTRIVLGLSLVVLVGTSARAAVGGLERVQTYFRELDYTRAAEEARRLLASGENPPAVVRETLSLLGQSLAALGQRGEARQVYGRLLALTPRFSLPANVSPKIAGPLDEARRARRGRPGLGMTHSPPPGGRPDRQLNFAFTIRDGAPGVVDRARLVYALPGSAAESQIELRAGAGEVVMSLALPALGASAGKLRYRIELLDSQGNILLRRGEPDRPLTVTLGRASPTEPLPPTTMDTQPVWYRQWWFWALAGAALAGMTTTVVLAASRPSDEPHARFEWSIAGQ